MRMRVTVIAHRAHVPGELVMLDRRLVFSGSSLLYIGWSLVTAADSRGVHGRPWCSSWRHVRDAGYRLCFSGLLYAHREFPRIYRGKWHRQHRLHHGE